MYENGFWFCHLHGSRSSRLIEFDFYKKCPKIKKNVIIVASLEEAVTKIKELAATNQKKFVESVDIAVGLGIDAKQSDQTVKGSLVLPEGSGKKVKVLVFSANEDIKKSSLEAGAAFAGLEDLIAKI